MAEIPKLEWKWREHRDGDIGKARFKCFDTSIQDCDGDFCRWDIKRGEIYVAMGETRDIDPAIAKVDEVIAFLYRAVEMNDFIRDEWPRLKEQGLA